MKDESPSSKTEVQSSSTETNALQGAAAQLGMRVRRERSPRLGEALGLSSQRWEHNENGI